MVYGAGLVPLLEPLEPLEPEFEDKLELEFDLYAAPE